MGLVFERLDGFNTDELVKQLSAKLNQICVDVTGVQGLQARSLLAPASTLEIYET